MSKDLKKLKGKINEFVGEATGDRSHEARGRVERATGREPKDKAELEDAKFAVRKKHHDFGERIPPQRTPHHER